METTQSVTKMHTPSPYLRDVIYEWSLLPVAVFVEIQDILTLKEDVSKGGFTIGAYTNKTLSSNGYFMKVIVLSGKIILFQW